MTHPAYSFLSQNEIDAANRSVSGMRKAADDFHFHLTVLKTFALNMQARVAFIEALLGERIQSIENNGICK